MKGPVRELRPRWIGPADEPWVRSLRCAYERFEGRARRELDAFVADELRTVAASRLAAVRRALDVCWSSDTHRTVRPTEARRRLFAAAADRPGREAPGWRDAVVRRTASELDVSAVELEAALFADLAAEQRLRAPDPIPALPDLIAAANAQLGARVLRGASAIELELCGNARRAVLALKRRGLICLVQPQIAPIPPGTTPTDDVRVHVSGPLSLLRHTRMYGSALAAVLPELPWCERWTLRAHVWTPAGPAVAVIGSGDPIAPAPEPPRFDSALEARFERDLARAAPDWRIIREPEPVAAGDSIAFPDFALEHRRDPARRWIVEVIGYWTEAYLRRKLAQLQVASERWILAIDAKRDCDGQLPPDARVVRYRRKIDVREVLAIIDPEVLTSAVQAKR